MAEYTRRTLLSATAGLVGAGAVAGCIEGSSDEAADGADAESSGETVAQASFFVFGDLAAQVAGDAATTDVLVPIGQHGHGWEPGPRVREDIRDADLLVHGMEGFQPWVDDILADLEADGADVATVDVSAGLSLLEAGEHGHDGEGHEEHDDHDTHDEGEEEHDGHDGEEHDGDDHDGNETHQDHEEAREHQEHHTEDGDHDGHDHEGTDPHFWTDPLRVKEAVGNVRQGFVDVDPDNADAYADNAEAYREELDDLHERIDDLVERADRDVLLLAGHDAFGYFAERYGVEVVALTDVSPDDQPTTRDVERAQELVAEHDLEYICADPLESQRAAEQLVDETDAEDVLPLTAMPGLKEEWDEEDWGYLAVMENVNLPTLERALDA